MIGISRRKVSLIVEWSCYILRTFEALICRKFPLAKALVFLIVSGTAEAAVIRVPADQPSIQQAINVAANGDLILVSPGTYFERINYNGKAIAIQSVAGAKQTIIDGTFGGTVVTLTHGEGLQSVLRGFTIQHGNESFGAGMMLSGASPTVTQNIFRDNVQQSGGFGAGVGGHGSFPTAESNKFLGDSFGAPVLF